MAKKEITYSEAVKQIEEILERIDNEELDIDELAKSVRTVSDLLKFCRGKLRNTEAEIAKILDDIDTEEQGPEQ